MLVPNAGVCAVIDSADDQPTAGPVGGSLTWLAYEPEDYEALLHRKVDTVQQRFAGLLCGVEPAIHRSPPTHYRQRCRFAVREFDGKLSYALFDHGAPGVAVDTFPVGSLPINTLMPRLMKEINGCATLSAGLAAVHFLGTQAGDMLVALIYGAPLLPGWRSAAAALRAALAIPTLVGRAKGVCELLDRDWVTEEYALADGRRLRYRQMEGSFSNPSAAMCEHTLNWLCTCAAELSAAHATVRGGELPQLLELYCGNGNHTVALARHFARLLAVEIDRRLCEAAVHNLAANGVGNASVLCSTSGRFCKRLLHQLSRPPRPKGIGVVGPGAESVGAGGGGGTAASGGAAGSDSGAAGSTTPPAAESAAQAPSATAARPTTGASAVLAVGAGFAPSGGSATVDAPATAKGVTPPAARDLSTLTEDAAAWLAEARQRPDAVLVDPPRCGLDADTRRLVARYTHILYVSCNPDALHADLQELARSHEVTRFAVFDHFAYTAHLECGVCLRKRGEVTIAGLA